MNTLHTIIMTTACALPALAGFPQPQQSVKLAYSQQTAVLEFTTDGPAVTKAKSLCDCTTVTIQGIRSVLAVPLGVGASIFGMIYADSPRAAGAN